MDKQTRHATDIDNAGQPASGSRRQFIRTTGALTGAAMAGALGAPGIVKAESTALETKVAKLGFIALSDAAPLIVALEKGYFAKHGMTDVEVLKQSSWGTTRDNLVLGSKASGIDGAHILTPMPYLLSLGTITANNVPTPMSILMRLNTNGQGISVSNEYKDLNVTLDTRNFGREILKKKASGKPVTAAMTFPGGTHDMWIRYWMAAGAINPVSDISTIVVPPPQMVANMKVGNMDCFCVGEPWNLQLVNQNIGYTAVTTGEIWKDHPEKSFAMRSDYVSANPNATKALVKAIMEAQMFCDDMANKEEVAKICSSRKWFNCPVTDIVDRLKGNINFGNGRTVENSPHIMKYWKDAASYPFQSHDLWFLTENQRWGYLPMKLDTAAVIKKVNREDIWRKAAAELGVAAKDIPKSTSRGVEKFFDGKVFDPAKPKAYLDSLAIKTIKA